MLQIFAKVNWILLILLVLFQQVDMKL